LGSELYYWISRNPWVGEALYAPLLFPGQASTAEKLASGYAVKAEEKIRKSFSFMQIAKCLEKHLKNWVETTDWGQYQLVGFSVCFDQLLASLAAARILKKRFPHIIIVLGGSSCAANGGRSLVNTFRFIDYVIEGEGESALLELCEFISGRRAGLARNIFSAQDLQSSFHAPENARSGSLLPSLDALPVPDYDDYFSEQKKQFSDQPFIPVIPVEFSRGCWWNKCTFCNLNLQWCGYRNKTAAKMVNEVETLAKRFDCLDFTFVDNMLPASESINFFSITEKLPYDFSSLNPTTEHCSTCLCNFLSVTSDEDFHPVFPGFFINFVDR